ncbi:heat-inducible transcriptional repressor HrcA [Synechococcus sp. RedBA-s]|uniref:HrcA family transcriptional regulator n=1 Tax=Synechococcus sp. RedBA-s TaxID=2823741 RepID=UPI0020CFA54B|nr:HrcA family transcriptional regulator [Synechococcus sp. RedBA-s]MCP9800992.1 HrcA family transcriptional regulator [Synechococcus sp. RedBA-s]
MIALPQRQQQVLQATVHHYVDTMEPVGSRTLIRRFGLAASAATVRSTMGALEQRGLLLQPHTSAGRIPSQKGYRLYVNELLPAPGAGAVQLQRELLGLSLQWAALDDLLLHLARRLADLTGLMSLITPPQLAESRLQSLRLVANAERLLVLLVENALVASSLNLHLPPGVSPELPALEGWLQSELDRPPGGQIRWENLPSQLRNSGGVLRQALRSHRQARISEGDSAVVVGLGGLLGQPEFSRSADLRPLLQLVEEEPLRLLRPDREQQLEGIWIGAEHPHPALHHCALVRATYRSGDGSEGQVALLGPMRMAYATALSAVRSVASSLQRLLS